MSGLAPHAGAAARAREQRSSRPARRCRTSELRWERVTGQAPVRRPVGQRPKIIDQIICWSQLIYKTRYYNTTTPKKQIPVSPRRQRAASPPMAAQVRHSSAFAISGPNGPASPAWRGVGRMRPSGELAVARRLRRRGPRATSPIRRTASAWAVSGGRRLPRLSQRRSTLQPSRDIPARTPLPEAARSSL